LGIEALGILRKVVKVGGGAARLPPAMLVLPRAHPPRHAARRTSRARNTWRARASRSPARCAQQPFPAPAHASRPCQPPRQPPSQAQRRSLAAPQVGTQHMRNLDPFLMLDELRLPAKSAFAGFPNHPHRGAALWAGPGARCASSGGASSPPVRACCRL
jgi:hypothetical protein